MTFGVPGQIPHYGYLAPPQDSDVVPFGPGAPVPMPDSLGELRPEILAIHDSQQASFRTHAERQQLNQARNARRMADAQFRRAHAGQPASFPVEEPPPPSPYRIGETSFERQGRTRPTTQRPIINELDLR